MRFLLLCLLIICKLCCQDTSAQTTFAPMSAEWYNEANGGVFHCYNIGDSAILGKTVSSIRQKAIVAPLPYSWAYDHPTIYTYTAGDTVFVFNPLFNRFTPLYIFNVADGDTVCIRGFHAPYAGSTFDTLFCFRVDSVRMVLYDTALLKTVYTQSLTTDTTFPYSTIYSTYGYVGDKFGAYAEKIGCINSGVMPNCIGCPIANEDCECVGSIRCYNDATLSIKLVFGACQPPIAVSETTKGQPVAIYPNPANDIINIQSPTSTTIDVLTIEGKPVLTICSKGNNANNIGTANIANGIYLIRVTSDDGMETHQLLQIVH